MCQSALIAAVEQWGKWLELVRLQVLTGTDATKNSWWLARFGLVLNRHAAINVDEVARMLTPGGTFL